MTKEAKLPTKPIKQKSRKQPQNNNVVVSHGRSPVARYFAERNIELSNPQLAKQTKHLEYFAFNYSVLVGAFIKHSQSKAVQLFDEYVDKLIATTGELIKEELSKSNDIKASYEAKGYVFKSELSKQDMTIRVYRNCMNDLTDLFIQLDELVTILNHLEKTPHMKTPELYAQISDFVSIPDVLSKKIFSLTKRLMDKFNFDARSKKPKQEDINFGQINKMLEAYQEEQVKVLSHVGKQPSKPKVKTLSPPDKDKDSEQVSGAAVSKESITNEQSLRNW